MKLKTKLLYLAAFLVIGLPLVLTGNAGAGYYWDGAVQHPDNGGWVTPNDMVCIKGVHTDSTLDLVPGVTNSRQCIYYNTGLTGMNPVDVTATHAGVDITATYGTYGACTNASSTSAPKVWDFVNNKCWNTIACSGTDATTKGTLTWTAGSSTCSDSAACTVANKPGNDGAKHALTTSICVDGSGNGIPLTDLDRTFAMCAAKGGTWKQTSDSLIVTGSGASATATVQVAAYPYFGGACVAYSRQFRGQDADGTPLAFGTKGTSATDAGFCYAPMNMTSAGYNSSTCPSTSTNSSTAFDWSFSSSRCVYAKGITGYLNAALTKVDGTTSYAKDTFVDLSAAAPTMGECLAIGASWNNWLGASTNVANFGKPALGTTSVVTTPLASTIPNWDFTKQAVDGDNGCLHCHSTKTQYNGPAERWKDSYLYQGHKNMLRKVTAGKSWAGPNADGELEHYTEAATGPINFSAATAEIGGVPKDLLYIFGDWMAPAPAGLDVIVNIGGYAKYNGTSNYSCAACHTTGWNNPSAGLCSLSSKTTSATCTAAIDPRTGTNAIWYPMIGVEGIATSGFTPAEPAASFPGITFTSAGNWVRDGIQCSRCHNATIPTVKNTQIAASQFPSTHATGSGMGSLADGVGRTNLCFGCHQSIAKTLNGTGPDADLSHPENIPVKNAATAPDYVPEFNGHVIGNSFLNSVHGQFTGNIVPNALGKYDLEDPTTCVGTTCTGGNNNGNASTYASKFQGYTCWQSPTSSSPAKTMIVDGVTKEIKTKADCESLYGAGSWRSDNQGTCVTCHDVHNSLFVEETKELALRKVCTDCHNKSLTSISHPTGPGTPLGDLAGTAEAWEACVTCHMPKATSSGFPMHLWRINTNANYRTFPTAKEFGIGATATKKIANAAPDENYTNAVWVDIDYVCGQCHGGSFGRTATKNGAQHYSKKMLSMFAQNMHKNPAPSASCTENISGRTVTLTDTSTDDWILPDNAVTVKWGDGTSSTGNAGSVFSHTYAKAKKYRIVHTVTDSRGLKKAHRISVAVK
jgi:predicted CXXCH cytochrome family protein